MDRKELRISAKDLGAMALQDFCPSCFWLKLRMANKLPFQIFPGIFSSIDAYTKRVVHSWFDKNGNQPAWLSELGAYYGYIDPPHYTKFSIVDQEHGVKLWGSPDGILKCADGSICIVDYKTAKFTGNQDTLFPMYEIQLNVYARIAEELNHGKVSKLALIYMEPITEVTGNGDGIYLTNGSAMNFSAHIMEVQRNPMRIGPLLEMLRKIHEMATSPDGKEDCNNCELLEKMAGFWTEAA